MMAETEQQTQGHIQSALCGATLASVEAWEFGGAFSFSNGAALTTQSIWRVLAGGRIAVTSEDHRQQFGLPAPVDAAQRAASILLGTITTTEAAAITGDLRISFSSGSVLEVLNTSSGYEGWRLVVRWDEREVIALGGGELATWSSGQP